MEKVEAEDEDGMSIGERDGDRKDGMILHQQQMPGQSFFFTG
jgi:hypothetical protein